MFERYTERARRVLFFARYEASQLGSISIESEHLLLGLIREGKGLTSRIFARAHISLEQIRSQIEAHTVFHEKVATSVEIPFSAETKRILNFSAEEADRLSHSYIGTEHLLLGILREERSVAASVLVERGMRLESVREDIVRLLSEKTMSVPIDVPSERPPHVYGDTGFPLYLPSRIVHISLSRRHDGAAVLSDSPRHWIMAGAELKSLIARAFGVDDAHVALPSPSPYPPVFWSGPGARFDVALILPEETSAETIARIVQEAIEEQFMITVTREARPDGEFVIVTAK
jgi:hypothetical protein